MSEEAVVDRLITAVRKGFEEDLQNPASRLSRSFSTLSKKQTPANRPNRMLRLFVTIALAMVVIGVARSISR